MEKRNGDKRFCGILEDNRPDTMINYFFWAECDNNKECMNLIVKGMIPISGDNKYTIVVGGRNESIILTTKKEYENYDKQYTFYFY